MKNIKLVNRIVYLIFLFAFLAFVFSVIILANNGIDIPRVLAAYDNQPASEAGIKKGDVIRRINGKKITIGREIDTYLMLHPLSGEEVKVEIERDGKEKTIMVDPNYTAYLFGFSYSRYENLRCEQRFAVSKGRR